MRHKDNFAARQIDTIRIAGFDIEGEDTPAPALIGWFVWPEPTTTPGVATTQLHTPTRNLP